jgi:hypothetical protein
VSRIFAIVENSAVVNVILADSWLGGIDVTGLALRPSIGWTYDGAVFSAPVLPPSDPQPLAQTTTPYMSHFGFLSRLTQQERTAIRAATAADPVLDDAMFLFNSAERIDVTLPQTQMLVGYLAQQGHIAAARVPALLAPIDLASPHAKP